MTSKVTLHRFLFALEMCLLSAVAVHADEPRLLSWDIGTFHGEIGGLAVLDQGERFATVGSDRVIRIHNSATGALEKSITGYANIGDSGDMHGLAASPDGATLAVGVNFGGIIDILLDRTSRKKESNGAALFDRRSGKLTKLLGGHSLPARQVFYTNDNKYLITVAQELQAWDGAALQGKKPPVKMVESTSERLADVQYLWAVPAGSSQQSRILFAKRDNIHLLTLFEVPSRKYLGSVRLPGDPVSVVAKGDRIVVSLDSGGVLMFDGELKQLDTLAPSIRFKDIDLSADANQLVACRDTAPYGCQLGARENGYAFDESKPFISTNSGFNPLFLNERRLLLVADDGELRLYQLPEGKEEWRVTPRVPLTTGIGLDGTSLVLTGANGSCRRFDLASGVTTPCKSEDRPIPELPHLWQGYEIRKGESGKEKQGYAVFKGGVESTTLPGGESDAPVGFLDNGLVAAVSAFDGEISIRTMSGSQVAELYGHEGAITSLRQQGDLLISTGTDRTVRLWDISSLRGLPPEPLRIEVDGVQPGSIAAKAGIKEGSYIVAVNGKPFRTMADFREMVTQAGKFSFKVKDKKSDGESTTIELEKKSGILGIAIDAAGEVPGVLNITPYATLLLAGDNSWVLWTERKPPEKSLFDETAREVCYAASAKGHDMLRWRINQGKEHESKLQPLDPKTEFEAGLPAVAAGYMKQLATRPSDPLAERFEVSDKLITDKKTGLTWLRNVGIRIPYIGQSPARLLESINDEERPLGHDDWRFPTEAEARELFSLLAEQKRRRGSFMEETTSQLLSRAGFLYVSPNRFSRFEALYLNPRGSRAWSIVYAKSFVPESKRVLGALLVRGEKR